MLALLFFLGASHALALEVASTKHFVFVADEGAIGVARRLSEVAEEKRAYVLGLLGLEDEGITEVRIASNEEAMMAMASSDRPLKEWIAGLCFPQKRLIVLGARGNEVFHVLDTFEHELAHLYLHLYLGANHVPRWFDEGVAMLVAKEEVQERLKTVLFAGATDSFLSPQELDLSFPSDPPKVHLAYAQAMLVVRFLWAKKGPYGLKDLLSRLSLGEPFHLAFHQVYGMEVEEAWKKALPGKMPSWLWLLSSAAVFWLLIVVLFLYAYGRKRRKVLLTKERWAIEEEIGTMEKTRLTKEEVQ